MGEKNVEKVEETPAPKGGSDAPAETKQFPTKAEVERADELKKDPNKAAEEKKTAEQKECTANCYVAAGTPAEIGQAVKRNIAQANKDGRDPSVKINKDGQIEFAAATPKLADDITASRRDRSVAKADSVGVSPFKASDNAKVDDKNKIGEFDATRDNPDALKKQFGEDLDKLVKEGKLKPDEARGEKTPQETAERMKKEYAAYLDQTKQNFTDKDGKVNQEALDRVYHSLNVIRDSNLISDMSKVNSQMGLAARGANPKEANRQGDNNSCSPTSLSRVEQQRDFAAYAERMASLASRGGAWMGQGADRRYVNINQDGTKGANMIPDEESAKNYDARVHQKGGERDFLGQLDNAAVGQLMAKYAGERDGKDYVYLTANANRVPGDHVGQSSTGEGMFARDKNGDLKGVYDKDGFRDAPPASPDVVGRANLAMGGQGIFIQKELADKYPGARGINSFTDAADLRAQMAKLDPEKSGKEFQIWTNGTMVAGRAGHGHHNQTIALDKEGQLVMGNNWTDNFNNKSYTDDFINKVTTMSKWDSKPTVRPDGQPVDWNNEIAGPDTRNPINKDDRPNDSDLRKQDEKDKQEKDRKDKEDQEKEDKERRQQKTNADKQAMEQLQDLLSAWNAKYNAAASEGEDALREFLSGNPKPQPKF